MNNNTLIALIFAMVLALAAGVLFYGEEAPSFGSAREETTYTSASSTVFSIGHQLSTKVLDQRSLRGYAILCNARQDRHAYLSLSSTAITATSSADVLVKAGECYEFDQDNRYIGEVHAIQELATSTSFIVTELIID